MKLKFVWLAAAMGVSVASGQVSNNQSLSGKYYFRQVLLVTDGTANVTNTLSGAGTITFDGKGNFVVSGQELIGTAAPAALTATTGTYVVNPGGFVTLANPLRAGATINGRLGNGALVGSSTEAGPTIFDLFLAIPAPAQAVSNSTLNGPYWISSLEFPGGGVANIRDTNFVLTAHGAGRFDENQITGQAANLGNTLRTQTTVSGIGYSVSPDGTGTLAFPAGDMSAELIEGSKSIYVSQDGTYLIGGSISAGLHGLVVGVRAFSGNATNASWNGFYYTAGLRYDTQPARLASVVGAVNAVGEGDSVWARRTRQSDGLFDASPLIPYSLGGDGSGAFTATGGHVDVASTGHTFASSGVDVASSTAYEIYFGAQMPAQSGTGVFLNPQGVLNAASFAPPGYPIAPGSFIALFGTGFGTQNFTASALPFPDTTSTGVQVTINGIAAPISAVSVAAPQLIKAIVPYGVTGSTASIVVTINGTKSNSVSVPLAATAPGIFSLTQNGLGDAAIRHLDSTVVNEASPALRGEIVSVYLTGLGAVNPKVQDGAGAPAKVPLAQVVGPLNVYVGGQLVTNVLFAGLTPTLAGLYQLNIQLPELLDSGPQDLAIQTVEGFTDIVNIVID